MPSAMPSSALAALISGLEDSTSRKTASRERTSASLAKDGEAKQARMINGESSLENTAHPKHGNKSLDSAKNGEARGLVQCRLYGYSETRYQASVTCLALGSRQIRTSEYRTEQCAERVNP